MLPHTSVLIIECFLTRSMLFLKCIYTLYTVTDASSVGATTTAGCRCIGSFETGISNAFYMEDIVLVLVYH